jgi:hypothetical protein
VTAAVLTPFTADDAVELGNRAWRKKLLPVGEVEYKGRMLHFTRDYLGRLVQAFNSRAYDQVPFQLADAANTHTNDPERTRGEITAMELGDDGLYVTAVVTPDGEKVLQANPKLGVSARIVEDYARSDGRHFPQAVQHVLGTLDPRIPGLGPWQAIEAASPVPDTVIDLSGGTFAGTVDLDWTAVNEERAGEKAHDTASATAKRDWMEARGGAGAPAAGLHGKQVLGRTAQGNTVRGQYDHGSGQVLDKYGGRTPVTHVQAADAPAPLPASAPPSMPGDLFAGRDGGIDLTTEAPEGTAAMADLDALTDEQKARLAKLLELPDDQLDALAAGGMVLTAAELEALTGPDDGSGEDGGLTDAELDELVAAAGELDAAGLLGDDGAPVNGTADYEGEPVSAGLSAEAQFAINLANARAEETQRELSVITARLREEDYQGEKRRLADLGVPPYITELARPLLEGAGHAVELANGRTVDSGAIMRRVLTEYARQARLLDLGAELGSPMDEPEDAVREQADQQRDDIVSRYKAMTGLK